MHKKRLREHTNDEGMNELIEFNKIRLSSIFWNEKTNYAGFFFVITDQNSLVRKRTYHCDLWLVHMVLQLLKLYLDCLVDVRALKSQSI